VAVLTFDSGAAGTGIGFRHSSLQIDASTASWATARTTQALSSGKWYVEFLVSWVDNNGLMLGITNASGPLNNYLGSDANSFSWQNQGSTYGSAATPKTGISYAVGDVVGLAIDVPNKRAWVRVNGGAWAGGGDPAAGTTPTVWSFSGSVYVAATVQNARSSIVVNSGAAPFAYTAPSGFSAIGDAHTWPTGAQTFDPANTHSGVTLSGGDLTATAGSSDSLWGLAIGTVAPTTGQHYVEITVNGRDTSNGLMLGFVSPFVDLARVLGAAYSSNTALLWFWQCMGGLGSTRGGAAPPVAFTTGDTVGLAWDAAAKLAWIREPGGAWAAGDPVAGTGGLDASALYRLGRGVAPAVAVYDSPSGFTMNATGPFVLGAGSPWGGSSVRRRRVFVVG
jgi:hypothetical protein